MELLVAIAILLVLLYVWYQDSQKRKKPWVCTQCKAIETPKCRARGSFVAEILLWCLFIVPGVLYTLWRNAEHVRSCPVCGSSAIVPVESPRGQVLTKDLIY
jgi:rubrerythrin